MWNSFSNKWLLYKVITVLYITKRSRVMINAEEFPHDKDRLPLYWDFCQRYEVEDYRTLIRLYDITELNSFLPPEPSEQEKRCLRQLIGTQAASGYLDYARSTNTFELLMQWQETTGRWVL